MDEQEQYYNYPQEYMNQGVPPMGLQQDSKADLLEKIKPDLIVEIIRQRLMGNQLINGEWVVVPELQERALTKKGAWDLSNLMLGVSSQNVSISKLTNDEIRERTYNICVQAMKMCLKNWKEYGIEGSDQLGFVHQLIFSNTFITLKQPEGEGIRKMLMGTISESRVHNDAQKEKGFFSMFRK